jgi:DNA-binding NarL/FixJ family response regulator
MPLLEIKIILTDDNSTGRRHISSILENNNEPKMKVIGMASNGKELIEMLRDKTPDIVILDLAMPVLDGYETFKIIHSQYPDLKVVMLSNYYSGYYISQMLIAGVRAFQNKNCFTHELIDTIVRVHTNGYHFNDAILKHLLISLDEDKELDSIIKENLLSEREIEILRELCKDKGLKAISESLHISENTVKHHKKSILKKTNSKSVVSLVKFAIKTGISALK